MAKPKLYRAYKFEECRDLLGKIIVKRDDSEVRTIISYRKDSTGTIFFGDITNKRLLKDWKFEDNSICGKEI